VPAKFSVNSEPSIVKAIRASSIDEICSAAPRSIRVPFPLPIVRLASRRRQATERFIAQDRERRPQLAFDEARHVMSQLSKRRLAGG